VHFDIPNRQNVEYVLDKSIVDNIIDKLMFDPEDEDDVSKERALSISNVRMIQTHTQ